MTSLGQFQTLSKVIGTKKPEQRSPCSERSEVPNLLVTQEFLPEDSMFFWHLHSLTYTTPKKFIRTVLSWLYKHGKKLKLNSRQENHREKKREKEIIYHVYLDSNMQEGIRASTLEPLGTICSPRCPPLFTWRILVFSFTSSHWLDI